MVKHIGTFEAKSSAGKIYVIYAFQEFLPTPNFEDPHEQTPGMKSLKTSDGHDVNRIDRGHYEVIGVFGNVKVTSDDPNAP